MNLQMMRAPRGQINPALSKVFSLPGQSNLGFDFLVQPFCKVPQVLRGHMLAYQCWRAFCRKLGQHHFQCLDPAGRRTDQYKFTIPIKFRRCRPKPGFRWLIAIRYMYQIEHSQAFALTGFLAPDCKPGSEILPFTLQGGRVGDSSA